MNESRKYPTVNKPNILMFLTGDHGQGAGGFESYGDGAGVMVHLDYGEDKFARGNVEELFLHESAHACLDPMFQDVRNNL